MFLGDRWLFIIDIGGIIENWVWRYQKGYQILYIEEERATQWTKEKVQKDKQWSTKHAHQTKDRVTWTPLKSRFKFYFFIA